MIHWTPSSRTGRDSFRRGFPTTAAAALLTITACSVTVPAPPVRPVASTVAAPPVRVLEAVDVSALDGWMDDDLEHVLPALRQSCAKLTQLSPSQPIGRDGLGGLAADWLGPCGAMRTLPEHDAAVVRAYFTDWFDIYRVKDGSNQQGLFTGYFEPELFGSRKRDARFRYPLLAPPAGLAHDKQEHAYFTRGEIEAGALKGKAAELLWVDDPVDLHILQIQGSGRVILPDGAVLHVHYAGDNGWPFVGIGKILIERGKLAPGNGNMVAVRTWLKTHPEEAPGLMAANPRYVFFRLEAQGPIGSQGVVLTPGRSLAVDPRFIPMGVPVWLQSADSAGKPLRRLVVAQDTGSAITGVVRGDFYWGSGEAAFQQAGTMKSVGSYFVFLPHARTRPIAAISPDAMGSG